LYIYIESRITLDKVMKTSDPHLHIESLFPPIHPSTTDPHVEYTIRSTIINYQSFAQFILSHYIPPLPHTTHLPLNNPQPPKRLRSQHLPHSRRRTHQLLRPLLLTLLLPLLLRL